MKGRSGQVWVSVNGERFLVEVEDLDQEPVVAYVEGSRFEISTASAAEQDKPGAAVQESPEIPVPSVMAGTSCEVTAPMPGDIVEIWVKAGQAVRQGDPLCVLDAMKMKNTIHSPQSGRVVEVFVREGQSVEHGTALFSLE